MGFCNCSMFCCALLYVHSSFALILMGKRELDALLSLYFWCLIVGWHFFVVPWICMQFVIVVFPDNTLFFVNSRRSRVEHHFQRLTNLDVNRKRTQQLICYISYQAVFRTNIAVDR